MNGPHPGSRLPALLGLSLFAASVARAGGIPLPGTQPGDIVNHPLRGPDFCRTCHSDFVLPETIEPWNTWAGSMMANSSRDPMFWAAVDIANQDSPGSGEFCIRCHVPRAWLEGRSAAPDGSLLEGSPGVPGGDFEGIECQFCHRLYEGPTGTPYLQNAQFWVDDPAPPAEPPMRGPFPDAEAPHEWTFSSYHRSSELCAVCHNVRNPLVNLLDESGQDTGLLFPEQTTYDEWAQSRFPADGVECQTCHMPPVPGWACTDFHPFRPELPKHELAGANAWMSTVLKGLYGASLGREDRYDAAVNLALDQLQNHAATVRVEAPSRLDGGGDVTVRVRVTNLTGHKLPTGYPEGRRMWLHVTVEDAFRQVLLESGRYDFGTATLLDDPDLRVYKTKHGIHGQGESFHLVLNDRVLKDTRIPPEGFTPTTDTMPVGIAFTVQPDGTLAHWDLAPYPVSIPDGTPSPVTVTAALYYQTTSREYVEFLRDENVSGADPHDPDPNAPSRGEKMYGHWDTYDRCPPILMGTATRRIVLDRPLPVPELAPTLTVPRITAATGNPFRGRVDVEYALPEAVEARVAIFDVTGRRVRELARGRRTAGEHLVSWDGRDDSGRSVAGSVYFVRLEVDGHAPAVKRIVRVR